MMNSPCDVVRNHSTAVNVLSLFKLMYKITSYQANRSPFLPRVLGTLLSFDDSDKPILLTETRRGVWMVIGPDMLQGH
jgi:hypothetical protein